VQPGETPSRGEAANLEPELKAPLSGRSCVLYALQIREKAGNRWVARAIERKGRSFLLADGSGGALIAPSDARLALTFELIPKAEGRDGAPPEQESLLARHNRDLYPKGFLRGYRFYEAVIVAGQEIEVVGAGIRKSAAASTSERGYRDAQPTVLHVAHSTAAPLSIAAR